MESRATTNMTGVLPVAFTGAPGAYSEEAARRFFGRRSATLTCASAADALAGITSERAGAAVFPVENTVTGGYDGIVEALVTTAGSFSIVGEVTLPIRHCLLAAPGARLSELKQVVSHPSAFVHCREWLANWGVETRESTDTARAAREVADSGDKTVGVLGSRHLGEIYELDLVAEGLSDHAHNDTRFWVAGPIPSDQEPFAHAPTGTRTVLLVGPVTAPRALKTLRIQLEARGTTRTRAPFLCSADATHFLVEFDHPAGEGAALAAEACEELPYRVLGCWSAH